MAQQDPKKVSKSWILASVWGWVIAGFIAVPFAFKAADNYALDIDYYDYPALDNYYYGFVCVVVSVGGLATGFLQMRILRTVSARAVWWAVANGLVWPIGFGLGVFMKYGIDLRYSHASLMGVLYWLVLTSVIMPRILRARHTQSATRQE